MRAGLKLVRYSVIFVVVKLLLLFVGSTTLAGGQANYDEIVQRYVKLWAWECMSQAIFYEARDQPLAGQLAVGYVLWNRAGRDVSRVCRELYRHGQFEFLTREIGRWDSLPVQAYSGKDARAVQTARVLALEVFRGTKRISSLQASTHFHHKRIKPKWSRSSKVKTIKVVGDHIFYREVK